MAPRSRPRRGLALISTLLLVMLLFIMLASAIKLSSRGSFFSLGYKDRVAALFAAEAGVRFAVDKLQEDPDWAPKRFERKLTGGEGSFAISFGPSVNNISGATALDGPRGQNSVPARSAHLIVQGRSGVVEQRLEVLIKAGSTLLLEDAIFSSGRVLMEGNVSVRGQESLFDNTETESGIHSNNSEDVPDVVRWTNDGTREAEIRGRVSAVSPNPSAIRFDSGAQVDDVKTGAETKIAPSFDIAAEVDAKSQSTPTSSVTPVDGTLAFNGDFYSGESLTIVGNVELDGGHLYVDGNLNIEGSISGAGSIHVTGQTKFKGDVRILASDPDGDGQSDTGVAVFSKGNVELTGFNGTQYLDDLVTGAPNSELAHRWNQSKESLAVLKEALNTHGAAEVARNDGLKKEFEYHRRNLGQEYGNLPDGDFNGYPWQHDNFGNMATLLGDLAPGAERDFMVGRFKALSDFYGSHRLNAEGVLQQYMLEGQAEGVVDAAIDLAHESPGEYQQHFLDTASIIEQTDYEELGQSYFQGLLYTEGYLYASNEVTVMGAIVVKGDGNASPESPYPGVPELAPGDIFLGDGARITFLKDMFAEGSGLEIGGGAVSVAAWMGR